MNVKEKIDKVSELVLKSNNKVAVSKLSEARGLYQAYVLTKNVTILDEAVISLLEVIELLISNPSINTIKAMNNKSNIDGELADFYKYLIDQGKTPNTADNYRKIIKQIIKKHKLSGVEELKSRIYEMINIYNGNDKEFHNVHTASLKQFAKYIQDNIEYYLVEEKENCPIDLNYNDFTKIKPYVDLIWSGKGSEQDAINKFLEYDEERLYQFNILKSYPKWRPIALYNSNGRLIMKES